VAHFPAQVGRVADEARRDHGQHERKDRGPPDEAPSEQGVPQRAEGREGGHESADEGVEPELLVRLNGVVRDARQALHHVFRRLARQVDGKGRQPRHGEQSETRFLHVLGAAPQPVGEQSGPEEEAEKRDVVENQMQVSGTHGESDGQVRNIE